MAVLEQLLDDVVVHKFDLEGESTRIGRQLDSDIVIEDTAVSAMHACISREVNRDFAGFVEFFVEDLGSTNGTYLNDELVVGRQRLRHNDTLQVAYNRFKFVDENEISLERTRHIIAGTSTARN